MVRKFTFTFIRYDFRQSLVKYLNNNMLPLKKQLWAGAKGKCQLCGKKHDSIIYPYQEYDIPNKTIRINRLILLCRECSQKMYLNKYTSNKEQFICELPDVVRNQEDIESVVKQSYENYYLSSYYAYDFSKYITFAGGICDDF